MIALIQRVSKASVSVEDRVIGTIDAGILALVAAERDDDAARAARLAERVVNYRIFTDIHHRMNLSAITAGRAILAVPQFTLAADTRSGNRPGFSNACPPDRAKDLFDTFMAALEHHHAPAQSGQFGADMQVALVNDGPVTFWLTS